MIPNTENARYWSIGITLVWDDVRGWGGGVDYYDNGWAGDDNTDTGEISTEGTLRTRYYVADGQQRTALAAVIDVLIADAGRLGVSFREPGDLPNLYYNGDGEDPDCPPPDGWRELLAVEAQRIGWATYRTEAAR